MVFISELQQKTLLMVDKLIEENKTFDEIFDYMYDMGYRFMCQKKNGYISKTLFRLYKNGDYSFVDLKKRKNGLAYWETIKLS